MPTIAATHIPFLHNLVTKGIIRSQVVSMAIGYGIAKNYQMPSQRSDVAGGYLVGTHGEEIDSFLSQLILVVPADYKEARLYAKRFFILQHELTFGYTGFNRGSGNALYDLLGITSVFTGEELKLMEAEKGFVELAPVFADIYKSFTA